MTAHAFVHMGTLARAHGLKGELCVEWHADSPLCSMRLYLQAGAETPRPVRVAAVRMHKGRPLALFEGVRNRTDAEKLRGARLLLPENELPETAEDELYLYQLQGLEVVLHENGRLIGQIDHVEFPGGQEIWAIHSAGGREILFPAVEAFVLSVDPAKGRVVIDPPPGLLELYEGAESVPEENTARTGRLRERVRPRRQSAQSARASNSPRLSRSVKSKHKGVKVI